jgi:hypothetical protein
MQHFFIKPAAKTSVVNGKLKGTPYTFFVRHSYTGMTV